MMPRALPAHSVRRLTQCRQKFLSSLASLLIFGISVRSQAQIVTSTWIGSNVTATGNWSNTLLWDIAPQTGYNVIVNNTVFPAYVTLDVDATVNQLSLGAGATLAIGNGRNLRLNSNSSINGTLTLNGTTAASELVLGNGTITLSGSGNIVLSANANNRIRGAATTDGVINQVTIQGSGAIGLGYLNVTNQGSIIANDAAVPLIITPNATGATNTGILRATNGGTLTFQSATLNNTGGTIEAQTGSRVSLTNATVTAGNITTTGTGTVEISGSTLAGVNVTNAANGIIRALSGVNTLYGIYSDAATSQVRVDNGARIVLPGGTGGVTLNGGIFLDSTGSDTVLEIGTTGLTVNGAGQLVLSNNANNRIIGTGLGAAITFGPSLTVRGAGQLGGGLLGLTNQGSIIADQSNPLVVRPSSVGFANTGTMRATNGATLTLQNGTFSNSGSGAIVADSESHIDVSASTVVGGILTTVGTGHFHALDSSTFSGVTITAGSTVEIGDAQNLTLLGNIVNHGLVSLLSSGNSTDLKIDTSVALSGAGNVSLSNSASNRIYGTAPGSTLTVGASQTISGAGEIGRDTLTLVNQGTIQANQSNALVINNTGTAFTNDGTLKASGAGGLVLSDATVTNLGTIDISSGSLVNISGGLIQSGSAGATKLAGGTLSASSFALQSGTLSGSGTVNGTVTASGGGTIIPGGVGSIGTLAFTSTLNLGSATGLYFDLGGAVAGIGYDRITGSTIALNGSLFLSFTNGFQSTITGADTLTLISTSSALNGTFAALPNGSRLATLDGLGSFQVNYLPTAFTLSNFQPIPEPSTYILLTLGAVGVLFAERRRRRR